MRTAKSSDVTGPSKTPVSDTFRTALPLETPASVGAD